MVKPTPPTAPEAPLRSDPAFSTKAQTFLTWLAGGFNTYVGDAVDFVDERADEALAAATTFGFPSIAGKGLNFTRVNSGATALEFRTPVQLRSDLGFAETLGLPKKLDLPGSFRFQANTVNTGAGSSIAVNFPFSFSETPLVLPVPIATAGVMLTLASVGSGGFTLQSWVSNTVQAPNINCQWFAWAAK